MNSTFYADGPARPVYLAKPKSIWPLRTQCSRVEQRLLLALRRLGADKASRLQAHAILKAMGMDEHAVGAFQRLRDGLDAAAWQVHLLAPTSGHVSVEEVDLLAALNRLSQKAEANDVFRMELRLNPLQEPLRACASIIRRLGLPLRQRTLPVPGRRFLEKEIVDARQNASMTLQEGRIVAVARLTPGFRRITIAVANLHGFLHGLAAQWIKLFRCEGGTRAAGAGRAYTVRMYRPDSGELDIDCALYGSGTMARWAATAAIGDTVYLSGVRGGCESTGDQPWTILAGDTAAIPAIGSIMDTMPQNTQADIFVVVEDPDDLSLLPRREGCRLHWSVGRSTTGALLQLLRASEIGPTTGRAWLAGEAAAIHAGRMQLSQDGILPKRHIHCAGYWKYGEQDYKDIAAG